MIDVRSPSEFTQGHIPGAVNIPLFLNEERAVVGTLYKQKGREVAFQKGLEIVGPKLNLYLESANAVAPHKHVTVHCSRGGQRSASLALLLQFAGFRVQTIIGGYKAYRQFVLQAFQNRKSRFIVLGGKTGSGKTDVLHELQKFGEQVIDLEGIARHKGSAFGALGELPQPTVEQFENELFKRFNEIDPERRTWVENESRTIGKMFIPDGFWEQIKSSILIHLEVPFEIRVKRLVNDYACFPKIDLEESVKKIERRMGGQNVKAALENLEAGDFGTATGIVLNYYDKAYLHATSLGGFSQRFSLELKDIEPPETARKLIEFANEHDI